MTNLLENNIYHTGQAFCAVTLKLFDEVRIHKRSYTTIIEVLGNIGGFMEVIFVFFRIICTFSTNILYELSLINNLFEFDLDKKIVLIHDIYKRDYYHNLRSNFFRNSLYRMKLEYLNKNNGSIKSVTLNKFRSNNNTRSKYMSMLRVEPREKINSIDDSSLLGINNNNNKINNKPSYDDIRKNKYQSEKNNNSFLELEKKGKKQDLKINRIYFNRIYICMFFCCIRKRKNIQNILLNEGMKIITERLDILYLFKKLIVNEDNIKEIKAVKMSEYCKKNIRIINERLK
jgi:hypothetical protein